MKSSIYHNSWISQRSSPSCVCFSLFFFFFGRKCQFSKSESTCKRDFLPMKKILWCFQNTLLKHLQRKTSPPYSQKYFLILNCNSVYGGKKKDWRAFKLSNKPFWIICSKFFWHRNCVYIWTHSRKKKTQQKQECIFKAPALKQSQALPEMQVEGQSTGSPSRI